MEKKLQLSFFFIFLIFFNSFAKDSQIVILEGVVENLHSFSGTFHQEYYDSLQDKKEISKGSVAFKKPGLMKWDYHSPDEMKIIIGKEKIWIYDPILENVTIQDLKKVYNLNSLSFLLSAEKLSLHFKEVETSNNQLDKCSNCNSLFLAPKNKQNGFSELQISFNQVNNNIQQFVIIDNNKNYRKISFNNINKNIKLKNTDFEFNVPKGVEVIGEIN